MIKFKKSIIIWLAYIYMAFPILLFFIGWLKLYFAIPLALILLGVIFFALKNESQKYKNDYIEVSYKTIIIVVTGLLIWTWCSGIGGFYYQSDDNHYRNAIFRDLINFDWPVIYEQQNNALVYYIGFWLPAAAVGKIFGWTGGCLALFIWTFLGLNIVYLLIHSYLNIKSFFNSIIALLVLILFSGLDFIGVAILDIFQNTGFRMHLEWWDVPRQYSSNTTQLMWVYNQALVPWMATILLLMQRNIKNIAVILVFILPFAPLPFLGLIPFGALTIIIYILKTYKKEKNSIIAKNLFSIQNVASILAIFPIFYFYYSSNSQIGSNGIKFLQPTFSFEFIIYLLLFYILEFLVFYIPIFSKYKNKPSFILAGIVLLLIPFFSIGSGNDFIMRVSIPALFILMILVIKYLTDMNHLKKPKELSVYLILVIFLSIGAITPFVEQWRAVKTMVAAKRINVVADDIKTLSDKDANIDNFITRNPYDKFFYMIFANTKEKK